MKIFYSFIIMYIAIFIVDRYILKKVEFLKINEYEYMKKLCNLKKNSKSTKAINVTTSLINAFIMSLVIIFDLYCDLSLIIVFPLSFVAMMLLIYSSYKTFGTYLKKKENCRVKRIKQ